jgi:hypothetical protein
VFVLPPDVAEIVTLVLADTALVAIVNVAFVCPCRTVTDAGTVATAVLLDSSVTAVPPAGAGAAMVIVPVEDTLPRTELGLAETYTLLAGPTTNDAVWVAPFRVAVMFPLTSVCVAVVVTVNVPVVAPAAIVAAVGTVALAFVDANAIDRPAAGAGLLMVTVPVEEAGPTTDVGLSANAESTGALTVRAALPD